MKAFNRIFATIIIMLTVLIITANVILSVDGSGDSFENGRPYRVEINRLARKIEAGGFENINLSNCQYVTNIEKQGEDFFDTDSDYAIREINGVLYRFDYGAGDDGRTYIVTVNVILGVMSLLIISVMLYIKFSILVPYEQMVDVPYELSKGNLTVPVKETKNRFFGRFIWGVDMLREYIEQQKKRELDLQRDKKPFCSPFPTI